MQSLLTFDSAIFLIIALASMFMHAVKKWANREIRGNLLKWYTAHPRATVKAVLTCVGGLVVLILTGVVVDINVGSQIIAVWGLGYGSDTLNNQGST